MTTTATAITTASAAMPQHIPRKRISMSVTSQAVADRDEPIISAPSPGAAAADDQATGEASRRRRNAVTVSMPDELMSLAKSTGRDPEHLAQSILAQQAPILSARAAEALKAVLP